MMFRRKQLVRHVKTGGVYRIVAHCQLEATNRPAYAYRLVEYRPDSYLPLEVRDAPLWVRDADEMEDGRFTPA